MNDLQKQLELISKTLSILASQVETVSECIAGSNTGGFVAAPKVVLQQPAETRAAKVVKTEEASPEGLSSGSTGKSVEILKAVYDVIRRSRKGTTIKNLREKTELGPRQVSNALYKLTKQGLIKTKSRGIYVKGEFLDMEKLV